MKFNKDSLVLYGITDRNWVGKRTLYEQVEEALKGGVTILQLREKALEEEKLLEEAIEICKLCKSYNVPFIVNDNVEIALKCGADGVHVGLSDMEVSEIRKKVPENFIIGATAKTVEQAKAAEQAGADYLGVGAVFTSATKKNAVRITTEQLREITSSVDIPAVAIGGITAENVTEIKGSGICGVAVVSAIFGAANIMEDTMKLKEIVKSVI